MEKRMFHVSALIPQAVLYDVLYYLQSKRCYNVESRPFVGEEDKAVVALSDWTTQRKRDHVLGILGGGQMQGAEIAKSLERAGGGKMGNPTGFLKRMTELGLIKKGKNKGSYTLKGGKS
jgi:hypothetical protein